MREIGYDREKAIAYAYEWAYKRNPKYYNFDLIGGDCTNYTSQCVFAGSGVMNYTRTMGWYYNSLHDRAPAWTGVEAFYNFLVRNTSGVGPYAREVSINEVQPGDFCQLLFSGSDYQHSPFIVKVGNRPSLRNIYICAHTNDAMDRPLSTYVYSKIRFVRIEGVRQY